MYKKLSSFIHILDIVLFVFIVFVAVDIVNSCDIVHNNVSDYTYIRGGASERKEVPLDATTDIEKDTNMARPSRYSRNYTHEDIDTLAKIVCNEAGGESEEMQLLVANVVRNRVESKHFPDTYYEVAVQPSQYGTMSVRGVNWPKWADHDIRVHCYNIAERVLNGETFCPADVVYQAEFTQGSEVYAEIDGMYFCHL